MKKVKLVLKAYPNAPLYEVYKVTNSVKWKPGETLPKEEVAILVGRMDLEVEITQR